MVDPNKRTDHNGGMESIKICECSHFQSSHTPACEIRKGAGVCGCTVFTEAVDQIYVDAYHYLADHIGEHGYSPTVRELGKALGVSSSSSAQVRIQVLVDAGLIERKGARAIKLTKEAQQ